MNSSNETPMQRRRFLKLVSTGVVLAPLGGLAACSGDKEPAAPASAGPEPGPAATPEPQPMTETPAPQAQPADDMPHLEESDPQARSLAYVHDATTVDGSRYPQYAAGQECANCALYLGDEGAAWGGCSIFPGKSVNARGWCSVYAPKS